MWPMTCQIKDKWIIFSTQLSLLKFKLRVNIYAYLVNPYRGRSLTMTPDDDR